jgi:hypothetical protein
MNNDQVELQLTARFTDAVDYARTLHRNFRKGTQIPYMAHLLGVASLVIGETGQVSFPVTEDMAIAALLHDAVEDEGGLPRLRDIEAKFGNEVGEIVEGCTDSLEEDCNKKQEWKPRKASYIERLWKEPQLRCWSRRLISSTTLAPHSTTTETLDRTSGNVFMWAVTNSSGITVNSSRCMSREARIGSLKN